MSESTVAAPVDLDKLRREVEAANLVFNAQIAQQNAIAHQQALSQLRLAVTGKCAEVMLQIDPKSEGALDLLKQYRDLFDWFDQRLRG